MTAMYRTSITATFQIEVEAESRDEAERIVDGIIESQPCIVVIEGLRGDVKASTDADDMLVSSRAEGEHAVLVRGSMHRSPA